jgi:signal transduction histidine kinase
MAGFGVVIWTIRRQQQLASSMVEFINNMTHEFKTPLSTVKLAAEAIQRHDVIGRKTKVLQYNRMVAEEAQRMKRQVDRILDLAQLEEGDVELSFSRVDLHALLSEASRTFAMQVEARGGRLTLRRDAASATVQGDPVHLLNILHSLLDNANKYSPDAPDILVATANEGDLVVITIADRGIGIPADHQKRVFEKYYRVPTGKLHDVKGFGIGLSYVKLMVEAHHGTVQLQSHPGRGTTVVLRLPVTTP